MIKHKYIFFLAIILSVIFWVQINLNSNQVSVISCPIKIINVPEEFYVVDQSHYKANVEFEGQGKDLLKLYIHKPAIIIEANDFKYRQNSISLKPSDVRLDETYNIKVKNLLLNKDFEFILDKYKEKSKPVKLQFVNNEEKEYFQKRKLTISPENIRVSGAESDIAEIKEILTVPISKNDIKNNKIIAKLIVPENIKLHKNEVSIELKKSKIVRRTISLIPIKFPENSNKTIIPQKVTVLVEGTEDVVSVTKNTDIKAFIDDKEFKKSFAKVKFKMPEGLTLLDHTPAKVQIIENK